MKNVHFWDYINCPVKITLKPNQELIYRKGYFNGEGYTSKICGWKYENDKIIFQESTNSTDCDGRSFEYNMYECNINELSARYNQYTKLYGPKWKKVSHEYRDFQAEAAGY